MICPKCKNDNPAGAKFCEKCGTNLVVTKADPGKAPSTFKLPKIPKLPAIPAIPLKIVLPVVGAILVVALGFVGYQKLTNNPEAVVNRYFKALGKNDLTTALALVVPEQRLSAKSSLDSFLGSIERLDIRKVKVTNVVVSDTDATAEVKLDFEMKLKSGQKFTYLGSKETLVIFDGKTRVEVPISEIQKYSEAQPLFQTVKLEKVKGKWYITR